MSFSNDRHPEVVFTYSNSMLVVSEEHVNGGYRHFCSYSNTVEVHRSGALREATGNVPIRALVSRRDLLDENPEEILRAPLAGSNAKVFEPSKPVTLNLGNAMLIAIPAKPGTVDGVCLVPKGKASSSVSDNSMSMSPRSASTRGHPVGGIEVVSSFDNGIYDVVIADRAEKIVSAIGTVAEAKRPQLNPELFAKLDKLYPKWTFLLFCFSEATAAQAGCAQVSYEPMPGFDHKLAGPCDFYKGEFEQDKCLLNRSFLLATIRVW